MVENAQGYAYGMEPSQLKQEDEAYRSKRIIYTASVRKLLKAHSNAKPLIGTALWLAKNTHSICHSIKS